MFTPSRASRLRALRSKLEDALSKPDVGSSKISREGSMTISIPTFTRFFWPPEIPRISTVPTNESLTPCRPSDSMTLSMIRTLSAFGSTAVRNVVFPAPDGPMTAATRPGIIFPVTLLIKWSLGGSDESGWSDCFTLFFFETARESCRNPVKPPALATSFADFHLSLAWAVSLACFAAASLDLAILAYRVVMT
nr:hypothetical protein ZOSMA_133G00160 [Ipomoea batatas]